MPDRNWGRWNNGIGKINPATNSAGLYCEAHGAMGQLCRRYRSERQQGRERPKAGGDPAVTPQLPRA
jgi:hypothetical protein